MTGTDATSSSTTKDDYETLRRRSWQNAEYKVPKYKIHDYNYGYAMSKLGQFAIVAQMVTQLLSSNPDDEPDIEMKEILLKIERHLKESEQIMYDPETAIITKSELDEMSNRILDESLHQRPHFWIAKDISICFTPLHALPWIEKVRCFKILGG